MYVIQSTCSPVNTNIIDLLLTLSALRRASSGRLTAVVPYFGYCRQTKKTKSREPVSAGGRERDAGGGGLRPRGDRRHLSRADRRLLLHPLLLRHALVPALGGALLFLAQGIRAPVVVSPHAGDVERALELVQALRELQDPALILGNEDLLIPILNSIPSAIEDINITMGLPLKQIPFSYISPTSK